MTLRVPHTAVAVTLPIYRAREMESGIYIREPEQAHGASDEKEHRVEIALQTTAQ
jgi:hypothetical protein